MNDRIQNTSLLTGFYLLVFTAAVFAVTTLLFLVNVTVTAANLFIALAATLAFVWFAAKTYFPDRYLLYFGISLLLSAVLFFMFIGVSGHYYDLSYDGQTYHQEGILQLAGGWNPFYDKPLGEQGVPYAIWIDHYAKAGETIAAALYAVTGQIELSKVFNFLLILASFFLSFAALAEVLPRKRGIAVVFALLLACNPVSIYQSLSFYVDGQLGSLLICLVSLSVLIYLRYSHYLMIAYALCMALAINNKFTAIAYVGIFCIGLVLALYIAQKHALLKKMLIVMSASAIIGAAILGFNPYVTNTVRDHNPFYPLAGEDSKDVVAAFTPTSFMTMNRFEEAIVSYFSQTEGNSTKRDETKLKTPFTFSMEELQYYGIPDTAISGFGPLFSGVLVLCLLVLIMSFLFNIPRTMVVLGLLAILFAAVFINYAAWWARYVPHLWLLPFIIALLGFSFQERKVIRGISSLMVGVLFINVAMVSYSYFSLQSNANRNLKHQLQTLKQAEQPVTAYFSYAFSNKNRFEEFGIEYKEAKEEPKCESGMELQDSGTIVCTK
ncbi:hypothetical protein [Paenibacillus ginsengarvi]|uniref:Glycosyltransferase RgtA/B/C/D-like domain-containing protein n=1 Tax=Paenibacillus ginsengarvi TaxID=400777 RepID=A0A3B0CKG3_9BACL|nr:hypothetical protein [Paenibacillus ginsengarvi]RKN86175.1 hypothetical protein D7M11_03970 [Paenibacillus ginsengarvi]